MECPACGNALHTMTVKGVSVDVCKGGCGGIWFDNFELKKFDEPHESAGQVLLDIERDENVTVDYGKRRTCPRCGDVVMMRHFFSIKRQVEVDECPGCGGVWLDSGELGQIRSMYATEQEREQAAEEYFAEVLGSEFAEMKVRGEPEPPSQMAEIFRFLSPRYAFWSRHRW